MFSDVLTAVVTCQIDLYFDIKFARLCHELNKCHSGCKARKLGTGPSGNERSNSGRASYCDQYDW